MLFFRPVTPESENTNHGILKYSQFSFQIAKKKFSHTVHHILFSDTFLLEPLRIDSKYHLQWWKGTLRH